MTPDQIDRLQLALTNMMLVDDGDDPITLTQLQEANAADPVEAAEQRAKVEKLAAVVLDVLAETAELPEMPTHRGFLHLHNSAGVSQVWGYTHEQMLDYARQAMRYGR